MDAIRKLARSTLDYRRLVLDPGSDPAGGYVGLHVRSRASAIRDGLRKTIATELCDLGRSLQCAGGR